MQFARVQGGGLAALGFLLLALQVYILFSSTQRSDSPTQAPATQGAQMAKFVPGILGLLAMGLGGYLVVQQSRRGSSEKTQPEKTKSGFPM